jgi:glycosyltransferase involved in cell wall biosynthesis
MKSERRWPKRVLIFRPPIRNNELYFRHQRYVDFLKSNGSDIRIIPSPPKGEPHWKKLLCFPLRAAAAWPHFFWAELVILSPSPNLYPFVRLLRLMKRRIVLEHYVSYITHHELDPAYAATRDRRTYRQLDQIVTHTEQMKAELDQAFDLSDRQVTALYCSVDLNRFAGRERVDSRDLRQQLGLGDRFVVFYHGMHNPWHGLDYVFDAARRLEEEKDIVFVVLPGDSLPDKPNVVYVRQEQPFESLPRFLALADVWCSGFVRETRGDRTFSSTMIQAMAMGIPVITASSPEKARYLVDGENVLLVPPQNGASIAAKIRQCYNDRTIARRIGEGGRALIQRLFNPSEENDRLMHIFSLPRS